MNWYRIFGITALISASAIGGYQLKAHAQQRFPASCMVLVPAEWGEYKGMSTGTGMVFEDSNGTLRIIGQMPCPVSKDALGTPRVDVEIRRK